MRADAEARNDVRRKVLVYGGSTYVGAPIVGSLVASGYDVTILELDDRPDEQPAHLVFGMTVVPVHRIPVPGSASAPADAKAPNAGEYDAVIHCGMSTLPRSSLSLSVENLAADKSVLEHLLAAEPRAFVLTSSAALYAPTGDEAVDETAPPNPYDTLGRHVAELERTVTALLQSRGSNWAILRCASIGGVSSIARGKKRTMNKRLLLGDLAVEAHYPEVMIGPPPETPPLTTDDVEAPRVRDIVHVDDVASAHARAVSALVHGVDSLLLNIGSGRPVSHEEALAAARLIDTLLVDDRISGHCPDVPAASLAISRAEEALGWSPTEGLREVAIRESLEGTAKRALRRRRLVLSKSKVRRHLRIANEFLGSHLSSRALRIFGVLAVKDTRGMIDDYARLRFTIADASCRARFLTRRGVPIPFKRVRVNPYLVSIPREQVVGLPVQTPIRVSHSFADGSWLLTSLPYSHFRRPNKRHRGTLHRAAECDSTIFVRQAGESTHLTVRRRNRTDSWRAGIRILAGWILARVWRRPRVFLYEKYASKYEESASVLLEALVDRGYRNARFVLPRQLEKSVPDPYRRFIVPAHTVRHYYHFFNARTLLGTETLPHAVELRVASRLVLKHLRDSRFEHVFLQHGVMYMVSLNARPRRAFRPGSALVPPQSKIVCSSAKEADHFAILGGFDRDNLYITGLPKFDRATRDDEADKILIMPTWRPWEHNFVQIDAARTSYVRMLMDILGSIPDHLMDRVALLPHPVVKPTFAGTEFESLVWSASYDEALRRCDILITDYSSIAYDAFYRGSKVVFWWRDKEECMLHYDGELMIDEGTAFGPVCYEKDELTEWIDRLVQAPQDPEYVARYREIVEFHDNRNTERLIEALERDGLI